MGYITIYTNVFFLTIPRNDSVEAIYREAYPRLIVANRLLDDWLYFLNTVKALISVAS